MINTYIISIKKPKFSLIIYFYLGARGEYLDNMNGGNPNPTWGQVTGGYPGVGGTFVLGGFEGIGGRGGYGAGYGYSYGGY
ncbi:unnamed protein product [Rotaria sp. Silwood2]|nr:unnamed protein product [Rotaria sp. Silwood2]CAF3243192.1 unnamed protein product [Rotaria sp. Silwood2]